VIRVVLCIGLSALTLVLGLWTAALQSQNYDRGLALNDLKERCGMLEAINGDQAAQILSSDSAPLPLEPKPSFKPGANPSPPPAPASPSAAAKNAQSIAKLSPHSPQSAGVAP
jgi:hypothetical protein